LKIYTVKSLSLQDQEQSLLDAIAKLDEASDGESDDILLLEGRIGAI